MVRTAIVLCLIITLTTFAQDKIKQAETLLEEGFKAQHEGKLNEAVELFSKSLAEYPAYTEAYNARASTYERLNKPDLALRDYTISLEFKPDQYEVLLSRGALLFQLKKFVEAKVDFKKLLQLPAGETNIIFYRQSAHSPGTDRMMTAQSALKAQVYNYLGLIESSLRNCSYAVLYLDSAISLSSDEADYYVNRALAKQACNNLTAIEDFNKALFLYPNHPIAKHNLAISKAKAGNYDEAETQLTEAIRTDSLMLDPYLERAYYRLLKKNYQGALEDYNMAIRLNRLDPEIWLNRGIAKEKLHDQVGAYRDYTEAIELDNTYVKAWVNRGNILAAQKKYNEAVEDYSAAITYQPDYGVAYYNRAIAYYRLNKMQDACNDLINAEKSNYPIDQKIKDRFCQNPK
ncbi:MAG: tetratricopeptide repeat protein [Cyclobacteriaceae bacterium]|nr:tetratricopeptide repeat protein [Cyclobacteriaceae bacterium]